MTKHDRTLDHYGVEDDTTTILSANVGRYAAGAILHDVLVDLQERLAFIESSPGTVVMSFTAGASLFISGYSFTADAVIVSKVGSFTANALLVGTARRSLAANAYLID